MHKHFRLLIGTGVVTVFVLTGTIYGFMARLAGSQRLKTSQTLIEQKNSEDATSDCKNAMLELIGKTLTSNDFRNT